MPDTVAQMTPANAILAVRYGTAHDSDTQVTDAQITAELDREYRRVRRWLSSFLPELYSTAADFTVAAGAISGGATAIITKPVAYGGLIRLEFQYPQGNWTPVMVRPMLNASAWYQRDVSGNYRLTYVQRPIDGYTVFDVPDGCEDLILEPVKAWVRQRHDEDPSFHLGRRAQLERELRADLTFRYGAHGRSILGTMQYWPRATVYEQGDKFVIY